MTERPSGSGRAFGSGGAGALSDDFDEDVDDEAGSDSDGVPTPASQPMSKRVADWYVAHTKGQLQAYCAADGQWYLYVAKLVEAKLIDGHG